MVHLQHYHHGVYFLHQCIISKYILIYSPTVRDIEKTKNIGKYSYLPFFSIVFNCSVWVIYGISTYDKAVLSTNIPGIILGIIYSFIYYKNSPDKYQFGLLHRTFLSIIISLIIVYFTFELYISQIIIGFCANCGSIAVFGSPLAKLVFNYYIYLERCS